TVSPRGCRITPTFFPYELNDLTGTVHYHQHEVVLSRMQARHGSTLVSLDKAKVCLKPEGGVSVDMADLAGNPLVADADFIRAMPLALQKAMNVMQPGQPLPIRTRLTVDVPEDRSNPTYVYWDGELGLKDVVVNAGVQMRNVTGRLGCRGSYQGGLQSL